MEVPRPDSGIMPQVQQHWILNPLFYSGNSQYHVFFDKITQCTRALDSIKEFLLLKTRHNVCEDIGSIPGLAQWVKDLALLQATCGLDLVLL